MLSYLGTVVVALVAGSVHECSCCWEQLLSLSSLGAFVGALVAGNGCCRSCRWELSWVLLSLGTVAVALVAGSVRGCSVSGFCWERSLVSVAFVGALSVAFVGTIFGALFGCKPAMVIELA